MDILIAIPARLESSRLPRKLLLRQTGDSLIWNTVESAINARRALEEEGHRATIRVLCDSQELVDEVGGQVGVMTWHAPNGTSRVAGHVAGKVYQPDLVINWQADEPEIKPEHIVRLVEGHNMIPGCDMATLFHRDGLSLEERDDDNCVKVSINRTPTEFRRNVEDLDKNWPGLYEWHRHIGIYAYTPRFLSWYDEQPVSESEVSERLEQRRAVEAGCRIRLVAVDHPYAGIDTREDYDAYVKRMEEK